MLTEVKLRTHSRAGQACTADRACPKVTPGPNPQEESFWRSDASAQVLIVPRKAFVTVQMDLTAQVYHKLV